MSNTGNRFAEILKGQAEPSPDDLSEKLMDIAYERFFRAALDLGEELRKKPNKTECEKEFVMGLTTLIIVTPDPRK